MIDEKCLGPDVDRSGISPDAEISGASYLTGPATAVSAGAVVRDSRVHDASVLAGASLIDSVLMAEGRTHSHRCDAAGRMVSGGVDRPIVHEDAEIRGCTLTNVAVGRDSRIINTWASDCCVGDENTITEAKLVLVTTSRQVNIVGPTEVSEAWLGHHARIDRRGYFEGAFANAFFKLRYSESAARLEVMDTIDLPHLSRYGLNTINSTNSGKLLPQPGGVLTSLGLPKGLWHDDLLSHEQVELGPCCWVAPWTKVIGQSPLPHYSDEELVNDSLTTYLMPFAVAGFGGELTRGLVAPGELSIGLGPKERIGAWAFTYAPDAVMAMVARLYEALEDGRKYLADTIVTDALQTALEMTKALAAERKVDLASPPSKQRPGWPKRIATTYALLNVHLDTDLWRFDQGRPVEWARKGGCWTHPRIGRLLAVAPDALDKQVSEAQLMAAEDPMPPVRVAVPAGAVAGTGGEPEISQDAQIHPGAEIGPGCRIGPGCVLESGTIVWNSVIDRCRLAAGSRVVRSVLSDCTIGREASIRSCRLARCSLGDRSTADAASVTNSSLADETTVSAFADIRDVIAACGTVLGGSVGSAEISTYLMSMHMAGGCAHLKAFPTPVRIDGKEVLVPAIPMLGGGSLIRGAADGPVEMECCFIGSNAIVEANTYVGFGCFVLGVLGPDAGLLPFTVSTGGPEKHQIGAALGSLASTVITHFVNWTYQAVGPGQAELVGQLVPQTIQRGIDAVRWEMDKRAGKTDAGGHERNICYRSLSTYTDSQLTSGLATYRRVLASGAWRMIWQQGELIFANQEGRWLERQGGAFWRKD